MKDRSPKLYRPVLIVLFVVLLSTSALTGPQPPQTDPPPLTAREFGDLIQRISEEGGNFWNDNYVSNEASYLHPLKKMEELGIHGGIYIGVGPNQNFTYIAKLRPRYAFIVDIRRQNMLEHLLFKSLFHLAQNRSEYLSLLLSRPVVPGTFEGDGYTVEDLVRYFAKAQPDESYFSQIQDQIRPILLGSGARISEEDLGIIERIHMAFYTRGLSIKYDFIPVPTYGEFLLEKDLDGKMQNFLNNSEEFQFVKTMEEENRIVPVTGDFAGQHALRELGAYLKEKNEIVKVFYASNVEQYLVRNMVWPEFIQNLSALPLDDRAVIIRAHWSNYMPHPDEVAGYQFTQILQWIKPFLEKVPPTTSVSYWDIVTTDTISLR